MDQSRNTPAPESFWFHGPHGFGLRWHEPVAVGGALPHNCGDAVLAPPAARGPAAHNTVRSPFSTIC
jgi:hypothetical protein